MKRGQPVVSVDTKKKEPTGDFKIGGHEWQPKGVRVHGFRKVIPYGVYDTARNEAWVSVGVDHGTAEFAVATLERWWRETGSNGSRPRLWCAELADTTGINVSVCHFRREPASGRLNTDFPVDHQQLARPPFGPSRAVVALIQGTTTKAV